jgi:hypothetical protein
MVAFTSSNWQGEVHFSVTNADTNEIMDEVKLSRSYVKSRKLDGYIVLEYPIPDSAR